jgi:hypothetical protein
LFENSPLMKERDKLLRELKPLEFNVIMILKVRPHICSIIKSEDVVLIDYVQKIIF